jgi:hypothetical protein
MSEWTHLATAPDQVMAEMWVATLNDAGIAAMIRPSDAVSFLGTAGFGCRVQVRKQDLEQALELLGLEPEEQAP